MHAEFEAWFCIGRWGRIDRAATHAGDMHWLRGIVQTDDSGKYGILDEQSHYYQARNSMHKHGKLLMINSATIHVVNDVLIGGLAVGGGGRGRQGFPRTQKTSFMSYKNGERTNHKHSPNPAKP